MKLQGLYITWNMPTPNIIDVVTFHNTMLVCWNQITL